LFFIQRSAGASRCPPQNVIRYTASVTTVWTLVAIVSAAWLLWVVVCLVALEADKRQHKRLPDATFSVMPVIPLFPLLFLEVAHLLNCAGHALGLWVVGSIHVILIVAFLIGMGFEVRRMRSAGPPAV
jgi:hypothetical protein